MDLGFALVEPCGTRLVGAQIGSLPNRPSATSYGDEIPSPTRVRETLADASSPTMTSPTAGRPVTLEPAAPPTQSAESSALGSYQHGLDGLRGVAMLVMLAYHSELPYTKGAFLGLSQFFTLSGFLITSMLLRSHDRGGIELRLFWQRRFQRLMPAALLCLFGVVIFGATVATRDQVTELPGEVFAATTYWANWYFVITDKSYVNLFAAPSPVQHYWSLAVEEQLYLVLPIAMILLLRRTRSPRVLAGIFAGAAMLSTAWTIYLYDRGAGLDRIYYGTDTRMAEMLTGALLAVVVTRIGDRLSEQARRRLGWIGLVAFGVSAWGSATVPLADGPIWRGGMLAYSLVSCAVILGILSGRGPLNATLSWGPLPGLGRIIYGLYLYHWPIFLWLTRERTGLDPWPLFGLRLAVTFPIAIASYHLLEMPIRRGALRRLPGITSVVAAPAAMVLIVVGAVVVSHRSAPDPFATIRSNDSSLIPPLSPSDGVMDMLVITDGSDPAVVDRLGELAAEDPTLDVVVGPAFSCREIAGSAGSRHCVDWTSAWSELIADHDPDITLLFVDDWPEAEIAALTPDSGSDPVSVAAEILDAGLDLLTANGAPVLWATPGGNFGDDLRRSAGPFAQAMGTLEQNRTDLHHVLGGRLPDPATMSAQRYADIAAAALVSDASLYQRVERGNLPRVLILGDSQARSLGYGLERWGADKNAALVWNAATEGCGLIAVGIATDGTTESEMSKRCVNAARAWKSQVNRFRPDLVIVLTSVWDLRDRRFPGEDQFTSPGDDTFDQQMVSIFTEAVDTFSADGAKVLWMTSPCKRFAAAPGQAPNTSGGFSDARSSHMNRVILPRVVEERPDTVEIFDLDERVCPGGEFRNEIDGVSPIYIDGVHFSVKGSMWFARTYGREVLSFAR